MSSRDVEKSIPIRKGMLVFKRLGIAGILYVSILIRGADAIIRDIRLLSD